MIPLVVNPGEGIDFGHGMLCRITSDNTDGTFCSFEVTLAPGEGIPMHVHSNDSELYYILEGELEVICDDRVFVARKGAMVFIPKMITHAFCNKSEQEMRMLNVFLPGGFDHLVTELSELSPEEASDKQKREQIRAKHGIKFIRAKNI